MGWKTLSKLWSEHFRIIRYLILISILCASFSVLGCAERSGHFNLSKKSAKPADPYENPYDARSHPDRLEIFKGEKKICEIVLQKDFLIQRWGFIDKGNYIVIRSAEKGNKIIFQLFKTDTCQCVDEVIFSGMKTDKVPLWANSLME